MIIFLVVFCFGTLGKQALIIEYLGAILETLSEDSQSPRVDCLKLFEDSEALPALDVIVVNFW